MHQAIAFLAYLPCLSSAPAANSRFGHSQLTYFFDNLWEFTNWARYTSLCILLLRRIEIIIYKCLYRGSES